VLNHPESSRRSVRCRHAWRHVFAATISQQGAQVWRLSRFYARSTAPESSNVEAVNGWENPSCLDTMTACQLPNAKAVHRAAPAEPHR